MGFWNDHATQAEEGFSPIPSSEYFGEVVSAKHQNTKNGKLMFVVAFKVLAGPHAGRQVWRNFVVSPENPAAMARFFNDMVVLGVPREFFKTDPANDQVCAKLLGARATLEVGQREYNGENRNEVNRVKPLPVGVVLPSVNPSAPSAPTATAPAPSAAPAVPQAAPAPATPVTPAAPQAQDEVPF